MSLTNGQQTALDIEERVQSKQQLGISFLGEFSLRLGEEPVALETPSYQSLLAYLVVHADQAHPRQGLAFQFWPDSTEPQARTNLRKALYTIRRALPDVDRYLDVAHRTVQWQRDAPCTVDVWVFETAVSQIKPTNQSPINQKYLEQAINAYHGDFMPGHYDEWVLTAREKYRQQYVTALEIQLKLYESRRRYPEAIGLARKLLREDPLHEAAYRRLMRLQSLDSNVAGALRTYHACSTRLQQEMGVDPSPATQEAYERLLSVKAPPKPMAPTRLPLVGRDQAWRKLQNTWKQCSRDQASAVLLLGEAGIGKTRLAEELLEWAERQGIVVLTAVCYPSEKQLAYAPVARWLRGENMQPVLRRLPKGQLAECSRLLPELHDQYPDLPDPGPLTESWQRQHLFSALSQTLLQLRQPFLLFIDDLAWCDQETLEWLLFLLRHQPEARYLLLCTARSEEITPDHFLIPWQQQLDRDGQLTKIRLRRLDVTNSAQLAGHVLGQPLDKRQEIHLYQETEGNPLFIVEMVRAGLHFHQPHAQLSPLPQKARAVIESRLTSLSMPAYELAQLAAVIGRSFTFSLLNKACTQGEDSVIRDLDELWQRRLIRERGVDAYDFSHDKIRQVTYESLSQARRRQLHKQVWGAMETLHADNLDPLCGQIAVHCKSAGQYQEAIAYYQRAALASQAVYANKDTLAHLEQAIALFSQVKINHQQQIEIYEQLGDVLALTGQSRDAEKAYGEAVSRLSDTIALSRMRRKFAGMQSRQKRHDQAFQTLDDTDLLFGDLTLTDEPAMWQEWLELQLQRLWLQYWANEDEEMTSLVQRVDPVVKLHGTKMQLAAYFQVLVALSFRLERYVIGDEVVKYAQEVMQASEESGDLRGIASSNFFLGFTHLWHGYQGDLDAAEHYLQTGLKQAEQIGHAVLQCRCLSYLPVVYRKMGYPNKARDLAPSALAIAEQYQMPEYVANARGNLAWIAWRDGDLAEARLQGEAALAAAQQLLLPIPMKWLGLWPLLGVVVVHGETALAVEYAQAILEPSQPRLPDELTAVLEQAINSWNNNQTDVARTYLEKALHVAQTYNYL